MSISHLLENFEAVGVSGRGVEMSELMLEEEKLGAFERGYKAGWDDATKAQAEDRKRVTTDLASNLSELSLSYQEAHAHVARSLKPLLGQIIDQLLPAIARASLTPQISEQLSDLAAQASQGEMEIVVSPSDAESVRAMLEGEPNLAAKVFEEPALGEGQAFLRLGGVERQINYAEILDGIARAVDAFFHEIDHTEPKEAGDVG